MKTENFSIGAMTRSELDIALNWAANEGWNPGKFDANCFYAADPTGFLIGYLHHKAISTISAVKYGNNFGFIGFYIVDPDYRGNGYGMKIWKQAIASLNGRCIGLDGVVAQIANYQKFGFKLSHHNIRYQGISDQKGIFHQNIKPLSLTHLDAICDYDKNFFPADRRAFWKKWISQNDTVTLGFMINNELKGFGCLRICRKGYKMAPLFADEPDIAESLHNALLAYIPINSVYFLDIPKPNPYALNLVEAHNMIPVFETARMYIGNFPQISLNCTYGITSFELG